VCFALEEVSFRGALDSHLHRPGERFGLTSALLGSILWGLWHLPTVPAESRTLETAIALMGTHALIGVPLAIYWRQSGNLVVPAFTHAMIDAVRNALRLMG
jgi:membrane protease YdiL (CAAX protease family)